MPQDNKGFVLIKLIVIVVIIGILAAVTILRFTRQKILICAKSIEGEVSKLPLGYVLFNLPEEMRVGVIEFIELRIAKEITEDFKQDLKGRGVSSIDTIKVGTRMEVRLTGNNFDVQPRSHEDQVVTNEEFTEWSWDVIPLKAGMQALYFLVTIRINIPGFKEEKKDYPVMKKWVRVKVNPMYSIGKFLKSYWQWIIGTILVPIIIVAIRSRKKKSERARN